MASITSSVGLASGIDSKSIIDQLVKLEEQPKIALQGRIDTQNKKKAAYVDLQTRLTSIRLFGTTMKKPQSFKNAAVASSDEQVLTGTASAGAAAGSYSLSVARLVSARQSISKGFSDVSDTPVGAGTITLEMGGGDLDTPTTLDQLNDGKGVRRGMFRITDRSGASTVIDTGDAVTVDDVLKKINTSLDVRVHASISGSGIVLTDQTGATANNFRIDEIGDGHAAEDLGIKQNVAADTLTGTAIAGAEGIDTTLLSQLRGGQGLNLGQISITDRAGTSSQVDLTGAKTVADVVKLINDANGNVEAAVKSGGNGITLTDRSGATGAITISDVDSTTAAELGIAGTFANDAAHQTVNGANLQKAWFSRNTLLRDLNGGKGVAAGSFRITDSTGKTRTIAVDATKDTTVGDLMDKINAGTFGVQASINANGDGLLLTDNAGGSLKMKVEELNNGTSAKSLNILGTAAATTIDGSWEKTVTITATDKLQDVQTKIQNAGWGVSAAIINDGSQGSPFRLSITSTSTGRAGRVVMDSGAVNLGERVLVDAQDAAVFVGSDDNTGGGGGQPMLITANSNTISGAIRGVTLNLQGVSKEPVTVNIARNVDNVVDSVNKFIEDFNGTITQLKTYTKYDTDTQTRGELLGDTAAQSIETELYGMLNTVGEKTGKYRIAADVGITIGDEGQISFDEDKFRAAYADDPDGVTSLFTRAGNALSDDYQLSGLRNGQGLRTNATGTPDFSISAKDGTTFSVDVSELTTMGQIIDAINNASGNNGKVVAAINGLGTGIDLTDKSATGTKKFQVSTMNGSIAASDLGLLATASNGKISGRAIVNANTGDIGGLATMIEKRVNRLIDPTIGIITKASADIDQRNTDFNDRIERIDELVASKRARLEKQFADMETSLSKLQSQQSALGSYRAPT